jgi:Tfp pilus assembly protein PilO
LGKDIMTATRLRQFAGYALRRMGTPGLAGIAALVAALAYALLVVQPAWERQDQVDARIEEAHAALDCNSSGDAVAKLTPAQQLAVFYRLFPNNATVPGLLTKINSIAGEQKLVLETGEYALTPAPAGQIDQLRITLPLKGSYPQIRRFTAAAMTALPTLSLQSAQLRRDKIADDRVEGRLVFVLFMEHAV